MHIDCGETEWKLLNDAIVLALVGLIFVPKFQGPSMQEETTMRLRRELESQSTAQGA